MVTQNDLGLPESQLQETSDDFLYELPVEYGGSLTEADQNKGKDSMMAFDIHTGADKAQAIVDAKE